jgi:predicted TIM-barrel fold metal-dependent hydrolase
MQRCTTEARALGLPDDVLAKYLYDNADRVLFKSAATTST